ncbi:hypothetical protein V491_03962 [Pseudogymnoascus sp. VKM F-3775]|nr:hypothetical protein V491_03962 [Pseudogymnoascus sp. VKM F-3775]
MLGKHTESVATSTYTLSIPHLYAAMHNLHLSSANVRESWHVYSNDGIWVDELISAHLFVASGLNRGAELKGEIGEVVELLQFWWLYDLGAGARLQSDLESGIGEVVVQGGWVMGIEVCGRWESSPGDNLSSLCYRNYSYKEDQGNSKAIVRGESVGEVGEVAPQSNGSSTLDDRTWTFQKTLPTDASPVLVRAKVLTKWKWPLIVEVRGESQTPEEAQT